MPWLNEPHINASSHQPDRTMRTSGGSVMFCPQCGDQNELNQGYCRQCGQPLRSIQLALDRRVDEAAAKFKKAEDLLGTGLVIFFVAFVGGLASLILSGAIPFVFSIILGFLISFPLVLTGLVRVDRLRRLLNPQEENSETLLPPQSRPAVALPEARTTNQLNLSLGAPNSVTENTT